MDTFLCSRQGLCVVHAVCAFCNRISYLTQEMYFKRSPPPRPVPSTFVPHPQAETLLSTPLHPTPLGHLALPLCQSSPAGRQNWLLVPVTLEESLPRSALLLAIRLGAGEKCVGFPLELIKSGHVLKCLCVWDCTVCDIRREDILNKEPIRRGCSEMLPELHLAQLTA